jgi:predicted CoA-binding protein
LEGVVEDAIEVGAKAVWAQLGVIDPDAADKANNAHIDMVMDKCIKVEYARLMD